MNPQSSGLQGWLNAVVIPVIDGVLVPLIFGVAFIVFIWGVYTYFIAGGGNDEKRKEGRSFIIYGIIGFVIMVSLWGIVNLVGSSLQLQGTRPNPARFGPVNTGTTQQQPPTGQVPSSSGN